MKRRRPRRSGKPAEVARGEPPEGSRRSAAPQGKGQGRSRPLVAEDAGCLGPLLAAVALAAVVLRTIYLGADPPLDLSWSQALFTDGARAVDGARNKIMYGEWMADRISPVVLFYPISNGLAYLIYRLSGVGLVQANLTGVLPGLATMLLAYGFMRRRGRLAGLIALGFVAFPYAYVIYSRTPLLESLQVLLLVAAFFLLLRGGPGSLVASGLIVGCAAFMVKLHALHFAAVALVFLFFAARAGHEAPARPGRSGLLFLAGLGIASVAWLAGVYSIDAAAVSKYFKSNVILAQSAEYTDIPLLTMVANRARNLFHVGSGADMFFRKLPVLTSLAAFGLISALSGFARGNKSLRPWEMLSAIWFAVLLIALSLLSYRPLRYFIPLVPGMCLLATSFVLRLLRGEPLLHPHKPKWFAAAFFIWLTSLLIHIQHDVIFEVLGLGSGGAGAASHPSLLRYDLAIVPQILIMGGIAAAVVFLSGRRLREASWRFGPAARRNLAVAAVGGFIVLNLAKFADYCADRRYSIAETAESLDRVISPGAFVVGDCATTLSLETRFRTLPSYGEIIRRRDAETFERYPITHFLIRFPTLYEYLEETYPDFRMSCVPVGKYMLCGRVATVVRYEAWAGYPASYEPTGYEEGMTLLARGDAAAALRAFRSFLDEHPESYEAMFGVAICLSVSGDLNEARAILAEGIRIAPAGALSYHVYRDLLEALQGQEGAGR